MAARSKTAPSSTTAGAGRAAKPATDSEKARGKRQQAATTRTQKPAVSATSDPIAIELDDAAREGIRLSFLMHDVSRLRRSAYDQYMKPLGITRAQWWVMAHLSRRDGMMQTQLADVLEVGKASLGDVVEGLESSGWVQRQPDPTDKRAKRVYLTRAAQTLIKRMTVLEVEFNDRVFGELPPKERAALFQSLMKVKLAIAKLHQEGAVSTAVR